MKCANEMRMNKCEIVTDIGRGDDGSYECGIIRTLTERPDQRMSR